MIGLNRSSTIWMSSLKAVGEFLFPSECLLCSHLLEVSSTNHDSKARSDRPEVADHFCEVCLKDLLSDYSRCPRCALPVPQVAVGADCMQCRKAKWRFDRVVTLGPYRGQLQQVVIRMKKPHEHLLRRAVAELIGRQLLEDQPQTHLTLAPAKDDDQSGRSTGKRTSASEPVEVPDLPGRSEDGLEVEENDRVIVSVPNFWTHALLGAADSAGALAQAISQQTGWHFEPGLMRRIRKTRKQGMLSRSERIENVKDAFAIRNVQAIEHRTVYLVDDVLTTGATCGELARLLKRNGAREVVIVVPARGTGATLPTPKSDSQQGGASDRDVAENIENDNLLSI